MKKIPPLSVDALYRSCNLENLDFETTASLPDFDGLFGQDRAVDALRFGVGIKKSGFNVFVLGPSGSGKHTLVKQLLAESADGGSRASDWCFVNNFERPQQPIAIAFPAGEGSRFAQTMAALIATLAREIPAVFETPDYLTRINKIERDLRDEQDKALDGLRATAREKGLALVRTDNGFAFTPIGAPDALASELSVDASPDEQRRLEKTVDELQTQLREMLRQAPSWRTDARQATSEIESSTARSIIDIAITKVKTQFENISAVATYLDTVAEDIVNNLDAFSDAEETSQAALSQTLLTTTNDPFSRYHVNVLVDNSLIRGAPIVYEDHPTYANLVGTVEHVSMMGTLVTDFSLVKAGALHRANGGYLVLDAYKLMQHPYAWEGLKRALHAGEIRIQSPEQMLTLASTVSLEPQRTPLNVKVILLGDRFLYYTLHSTDPEFCELFKVAADFEDTVTRSAQSMAAFAGLVATLARKHELKPVTRPAVQRLIEHASRVIEDKEQLSAHMRTVTDILCEADYLSGKALRENIDQIDVEAALDARFRRDDRVRSRTIDSIRRGTVLIETSGKRVGRVNGLSVMSVGDMDFGVPSRISASARLGDGEVLDIEREVELGGAFHSKGVHILTGFIGQHYAKERPLSLAARVVFEQSYGEIDGDSASSAELLALLSAIAEVPLKQCLAITGSVSQHGDVQAIGGVNEKIEGFFDVCHVLGLTGDQGVIVPQANVPHLMLERRVLDAVRAGQFHIYAVSTVDEAISLLADMEPGDADANGDFPEDSFNHTVSVVLRRMAEHRHEHVTQKGCDDDSTESTDDDVEEEDDEEAESDGY